MKKLIPLVALVGLSACTVYPDGTTVVHSPPRATYVAPVYSAPVYVAPPRYHYYAPRPYYVAPYYGPHYRR